METGHERPNKNNKTRHNFSFPNLKWGSQRNLRCMKIESTTVDQRLGCPSSPFRFGGGGGLETGRWRSEENGEEEGIEEVMVKIMSELRAEKESIFRDYEEEEEEEEEKETAEVKPWNLRKRRAACKAPVIDNCEANQYKDKEENTSMRSKLMSTLLKKEVEDDYLMMIGQRPPRRPKKRLRTVQKHIDLLYPAFYFAEVTQDIYKVPDAFENVKR